MIFLEVWSARPYQNGGAKPLLTWWYGIGSNFPPNATLVRKLAPILANFLADLVRFGSEVHPQTAILDLASGSIMGGPGVRGCERLNSNKDWRFLFKSAE